MSLYTLKYQPQNCSQLFGQDLAVSQLKDFIVNYKSKKQKAALLYGPVGVGKTASVYALAKELKYDLLEINSSDLRNADSIKNFLGAALGQQSLFFTPKMILIDEIDNVSGVKDRGCLPAILKAIESSSFPVILTANDPFDKKFKGIMKASLQIEFHKLDYKNIAHCLKWIAEQENIVVDEKAINSLARQADGDLRAALIDFQVCSSTGKVEIDSVFHLSDRKRTDTILNALHIIFKSSSVENALRSLDDVDVDLNQIFLWMDYNLPKEYLKSQDLARAYEHLSRADVFKGRIRRRQHWRFLVYIFNLLTAGISSAKDERNPEFIKYKQTMRLLRIWQANMKNAKRKEIASKLAGVTHTSTKMAIEQIPYLQIISKSLPGKALAEELELTEEEAVWLKR
jgi:replication factor C large subunit